MKKMNKKVCILTSVHEPFDTRIFHKQAKSLLKVGYDVTLIAQHDKGEIVEGVKIVALPKTKGRLRRMLGTWRVFKLALKQRAEFYHFHDPELIPIAVLLKLLANGKVIYDVHEDYPRAILAKEWVPSYSRGFISRLYALVEKLSFHFFDAVVVAAEDIAAHFPTWLKVVKIRNFPSLELAKGIREKRKGREEPVLLIYVGSLTEDRGAREMVEVVNRLESKAELILVGRFLDSSLEAELRAKAGEHVQFIGFVPYEEVVSFLSKADVGLVCLHPTPNNIAASWRNNKLFEYMTAGLPIIASNFPLWKETVEDNNCGLTVDPLNPAEIARAVEYLIEHPDEARQMGENGRKAVIEKYNWETESRKLIDLYKDLN